jgi:outer membrane protein assembly factor BamA/autotransporter translocation and assembly factor TamB
MCYFRPMRDAGPPKRSRRVRWSVVAVTLLVALALGFAGLHLPSTRRLALRFALSRFQQSGVIARADRLDYNLSTLNFHLAGLTLATPSSTAEPFFAAKDVQVNLSPAILFGRIDLHGVAVDEPRVVLVRRADGTTNWPSGSGTRSSAAPRIPIRHAAVNGLTFRWQSPQLSAEIGASFELNGSDATGRLAATRPGWIVWNNHRTTLQAIDGRLGWNGTDVNIGALTVRLPEGILTVDGQIEQVAGKQRLALHVVADADLPALARWFDYDRAIGGSTRVDGRLTGLLSDPDVVMTVDGRDIAVAGVPPASVEAAVRIADKSAELTSLRAGIAGGSLSANGRMAFDGPGALRARWEGIDLAVVLREALPDTFSGRRVPPSARLSGTIDARWTSPRLDTVELAASTRAAHGEADVGGGPPVDGSATLALRALAWRLTANDIGTTGARANVNVSGRVNADHLLHSTIAGSISAGTDDAGQLAASLARSGLIRTPPHISGSGTVEFAVAGNVDALSLDGPLRASIAYESLPATVLRAQASLAPDGARVREIDVRLGASSAQGELGWSHGSDALSGAFSASVAVSDLAGLSSSPPTNIPFDGRIGVSASLSGTPSNARLNAAADSSGFDVAGQHVDRASAAISVDVNRTRFVIDPLTLQTGSGRLEGRGDVDLTGQTYTAHLTAADVPIRPLVGVGTDSDVPISATLNGTFDGDGSFANLGGRGHVSLAGTRLSGADLGDINADVTLAGRNVSVSIEARELALKGNGSAGVDANGALVFHGEWSPTDLAAIAQRLGVAPSTPVSGSARIQLELNGSRDRLDRLHSVASLEALNLIVSGQTITLARPGRIEYDGQTARAGNVALAAGTTTLVIDGSIGDQGAPGLTASVDGSLADFAFVRDLITPRAGGAAPLPAPVGSVQVRLSAGGAVARPVVNGTLQITDGRVPLTPEHSVTGVGLSGRYEAGVLTVDSAAASFEGASLTASARVPSDVFADRLPPFLRTRITAANGAAALSARLLSVTPAVAAPFVDPQTLKEFGGRIDATMQIEADRASLDRVRGTVALDRAELALGGVPFDQQVPTRLVIGDGRLTVEAWEWGRGDNRLAVRGGATLGGDPSLSLTATSVLDLRVLNILTPGARVLGRADSEIRITGSVKSPTLDGWVTFSNGEARIANPRLVVSDVTGTVTLAADTVTFQRMFASVNGGDSEIAGTLRHRWFTPLGGRLTMVTNGAALAWEGLRAEANANLVLDTEPGRPVVTGTVTVVRSTFREQLSLTTGLLRALQAPSIRPVAAAPSALDRLRFDVRIVTENELVVDNNYGKFSASADLRLVGTATRPSLIGRTILGEGGVIYFGTRRYRLDERGYIDFTNQNKIEPDLYIIATASVQGTDITLTLTGTPSTLQTALDAPDHPEYSESDKVALLLTGQTAGAATSGGISSNGTELLGLLSGEFLNTAGQAVGLSTVRVESGSPDVRFDAGLVATETDPGTRLTIGRNIGSRFEVVFSQSLSQSGGLTWIVSYSPKTNLILRAVNLDSGDRVYDFRHDLTFGQPASYRKPVRRVREMIASVQISGAGADESAIRSRLKLETGDRFSFFQWQDDRERIETFFHEQDRLEARVVTKRIPDSADATRIALTYDVRPGPRTTVQIQGFMLSSSVVRDIKEAWTNAVVDDLLGEEVVRVARAALVDEGFLQASVTTRMQTSPDQKRLLMLIESGTRAGNTEIRFTGNKGEAAKRLQAVLEDARLRRSVWIEPDAARDALTAFYRANGYLKATVRLDPILREGNTVVRPIQIDEGEPFRIQDIRVEGSSSLSPTGIIAKAGLLKGEVVTEDKMEQARAALDQAYRALGFNSVDVTLQSLTTEDRSTVDLFVRVDEGRQQRLRDIATTGVEHTRPSLVSRALKLNVGEPVNLAAWNDARRRLYETGAFRSVDIEREAITEPAGDAANPLSDSVEAVRALVTVQEWARYRLRYGLELNDTAQSGDPSEVLPTFQEGGRTFSLGATGDVAARNLFGRAVTAGVAARYTLDFRAARTYLTMPTFLGRRITSTVYVEQSHEATGVSETSNEPAFNTDKTTFTFEQRVRPFRKVEVQYGYSIERNHTFDLHPDPIIPYDITATTAKLTSAIVVDRRNDVFDATRGWFHASSVEYAPAWLSPDLRLARLLIQQRYYHRVGQVVFASWAQVGLATGFDQVLIPSDRFFAGGGNSVRGYAEQVLSPTDVFGTIVGGNALLVLNQEIRFPMFKYVGGVGFIDAGRAFETVDQLSLNDLAVGTGIGFRVHTPVVLLRFDMGVPLDTSFGPRRPRWFFSIGQMF